MSGRPNEAGEERGNNAAMTQLSSFRPLPRPAHGPAGTTQLTPFPSAVEGNCPATSPSSFPMSQTQPPSRRSLPSSYCTPTQGTDSRGIPITRLPPLATPADTRGRFLRRRGASRCAASPRRDERAKPAQKVPFERKTPLSLSLFFSPSFYSRTISTLSFSSCVSLSFSSSTSARLSCFFSFISAGSFSLFLLSLSLHLSSRSYSLCLGSFSGPPAILFLFIPRQGRTMQREPGARIREGER